MAQICIGEDVKEEETCKKIPERIFSNATFVVDLQSEIDNEDISCDSVVYTSHSSPSEKVLIYVQSTFITFYIYLSLIHI